MLSSTDPVVVVDLSTQPSQDPQPPATTDHPAPAQTSLARHSATPRDQITPIPLPNLTPETPQSAFDNPHSPIPQLSPQQLTAISLLLVGHSAPAAAAILGVHRGTLHRWKTRHPSFVAEYNRRQSEALEAARARLSTLLLKTLDLIHSSLTRGKRWQRIENAYKLFRMLPCRQLAAAPPTGPTELEPAIDAAIRLQRVAEGVPEGAPITQQDREHYLKTFELP